MERSKLSHVISTTRLLPHLCATNINVIKLCIFEQLEIKTDAEFLDMALKTLYKSLSPESLSIIKNKAIELAENQLMEHSQSNAKASSQQQGNMTVYKYIQNKYDKGLCRLPSDIIDYLGTFLSKQESIEFGYLNKHLFIETQKQSYLLKRCNDDVFGFTPARYNQMILGKNDAFNYTFPQSLTLRLKSRHANMVEKIPFFNNFFRRLSVLHCNSFASLFCVPLHHVFVKHRNYYPNSESCDNIDLFRVSGYLGTSTEAAIKEADIICKNFDRLILEHSGDDKIRGIKQFEYLSSLAYMNSFAKRLFTRFCSISKSIHLSRTKFTFDTISEIKSIFHPDLKHIYFDYLSEIHLNIDMKNVENGVEIAPTSLENIEFETEEQENVASCIDTLNQFDKFGIRQNIKQYTLRWDQPSALVSLEIGNAVNVFDKIFFQDYDKHPLLESIIIKVEDDTVLVGLPRLLLYFHQHYKQLFVERKFYLKHFQTIEIEIDNSWMSGYDIDLQEYPHGTTNPEFFDQKRNKEYSIDDKRIEISSNELKKEIESFGIVYQNTCYWLTRRQDKSGTITFQLE